MDNDYTWNTVHIETGSKEILEMDNFAFGIVVGMIIMRLIFYLVGSIEINQFKPYDDVDPLDQRNK